MLIDSERKNVEIFVLWSGDSDFADPVKKLLEGGRRVVLCATAGKIASELNELKNAGLQIFDIYDIKDFICWNKEISRKVK